MQKALRQKQKYTLFTAKALAALIIPIVVESALSMSLGMIDGLMASNGVSGEGNKILSAITSVDQVSSLLIQLFAAFGAGGAIITSQLIGADKTEDANKSAKQLIVIMLLSSLVVMALCMGLNRQIIELLFGETSQETKDYACQYFLVMAASYPFLAVFNCCAAVLRAQRKSMNTMLSAIISFFLNVGFNAVFIYWARLEVVGVALGTLLARVFPAIFTLFLATRKSNAVRIKIFEKFRFDGKLLKQILKLGVPGGIESSLFQLGKIFVIVFISIGAYNTVTGFNPVTGAEIIDNFETAANSAAYNINTMSSIVGNGINTSILTVIGQAIGQGDIGQVKHYIKKMLILSYIGNAVCVALVWGLAEPLLTFYNISPEAREIARKCLTLCLSVQFLTYPLSFGLPAVLKASSDVKYVMFAAVASMLLMRVGLCYILTCEWAGAKMGAFGLWIGMVSDWVLRSLLFGGRLLSGRWKKSSGLLAAQPAGQPVAEACSPASAEENSSDSGAEPVSTAQNFAATNGQTENPDK